jgi:hypothetical protein
MSTEPIIEQIAQEIKSRLSNVTKANGFNQNLVVIRPSKNGIPSVSDNIAILTQESSQSDTSDQPHALSVEGNPYAQAFTQDFRVQMGSRQSDNDNTPAETYINRLWADVVKAITRKGKTDEATWHTFGDLALTATIQAPFFGAFDDTATADVDFTVSVQYRTNENDPYTAR